MSLIPEYFQDGFWDTKWDAMQLEKKIEKGEKKGRYYLNNKRFKVRKDGSISVSVKKRLIPLKRGMVHEVRKSRLYC